MSDTPRSSPPADPSLDAVQSDGFAEVVDLIELRRLASVAEQGRLQAEAAVAAQQKLLATLAHELRSPLASVLLHAQLLREGAVEDRRDLRRIADSLERAVKQQTQLIDRLRDGSLAASREPEIERRGHVEAADMERRTTTPSIGPVGSISDRSRSQPPPPTPRRSLERPGRHEQYERLKDVRILYIDDDFVTREAVLEVLELTGARVALAASTADGMMALDTFKPHVIVCDLAMPGEDGYTFMRKLRASEAGHRAQIPVLAFTGRASVEDKRDALAAGFQMYLSKPIDIDRLRNAVAQLVELIGGRPAAGPDM